MLPTILEKKKRNTKTLIKYPKIVILLLNLIIYLKIAYTITEKCPLFQNFDVHFTVKAIASIDLEYHQSEYFFKFSWLH